MSVERLDVAAARIDEVRDMLTRGQTMSGEVRITEAKLDAILDILALLVDEVRELQTDESDVSGGGISVFDQTDRPWEGTI